jgi:hypothetical protein
MHDGMYGMSGLGVQVTWGGNAAFDRDVEALEAYALQAN